MLKVREPFCNRLCKGVLRSPLKGVHALSRSQRMAAIALPIIILLNYLAFYYAYGGFEGSARRNQKKRDFFPAKNPVDACREVVYVLSAHILIPQK